MRKKISERLKIGKILWDSHLTAEVYRAEQAQKLMVVNDPEPPYMYLYKAKIEKCKRRIQSMFMLQ